MTQSESRLVKRCLAFARVASLAAVGVGSLALVGWLLDIGFLKSVLPAAATMKPNTAAGFVLAGLALWLRMGSDPSVSLGPRRSLAARACAVVVTLVGLLTLSEYVLNVNLGIDEVLFREVLLATPDPNPGRMAFATALASFVLGMALLFLDVEPIRGHRLSPSLALLTSLIGLVALLGYVYDVQALQHFAAYSSMALHTSVLFVLLGVGALCARPTWGLMATLMSEHDGGWMMRHALPVALTLPFVIGWLRLAGEKAGLYETEFGLTLFATSNIAIFAVVIWLNARALNRVDAQRRQTEAAIQRSAEELQRANERMQREIAERRLAGEALLQSEDRFAKAFRSSPAALGIARLDDGHILDVNEKFLALTGYSRDEVVGRTSIELGLIQPEYRSLLTQMLQSQGGSMRDVELAIPTKSGERRTVLLSLERIDLAQGPCLLSILYDISARKRAEAAALESEARYHAVLDAMLEGCQIIDFDWRYVYVNDVVAQQGRHKPEELLNHTMMEMYPGIENTEFFAALRQCMAERMPRRLENQFVFPDGEVGWFELSIQSAREGIFILSTDITERKKMEAEIRRLNEDLEQRVVERTAQLQESEEKFSKAFLASPAGISIARAADGRYLDVNEALAHMTGYSREELIGHTSVELELVDAGARAEILRSAQTQGSVRDVEIQVYTKSKQIVDVLLSIEPIELSGQACLLTIQYDITERKRAEAEVRRLNQELELRQIALETANQELDAFAYSVSHDLRAPLRAIDGYSRLVVEDYAGKLDAEGNRLMSVIRASTRKMDVLITNVLALSRFTRSEMRLSRIDMTALAHLVYQDIASPEAQHKFVFSVASLPEAYGDPTLLRQVWINLISNAIKYTLPRDERRIDIGGYPEQGMNVYFVKDTGVGFNPDYTPKLFGMFQRLHTEEEFEGTGVGLAIVQRIVQRHGGRVWAEGQIGQGATIYFSLPRQGIGQG